MILLLYLYNFLENGTHYFFVVVRNREGPFLFIITEVIKI